jgi:hypothetical protein
MAMKKGHDAREAEPSRSYPDLHDQLDALDKAGLLLKIDIPINKDTEIHPLGVFSNRGCDNDGPRQHKGGCGAAVPLADRHQLADLHQRARALGSHLYLLVSRSG